MRARKHLRDGLKGLALVLCLGFWAGAGWAAGGQNPTRNKDLIKSEALIQQARFDAAIECLKKVIQDEPRNADAYNFLGFSHRKLGNIDQAFGYYFKALSFQPSHLGANEYLGELYLELGDLAKAEERLAVLDWACLFGCQEYSDLKQAIADFKKKALD